VDENARIKALAVQMEATQQADTEQKKSQQV
jgi:hypothetical protein